MAKKTKEQKGGAVMYEIRIPGNPQFSGLHKYSGLAFNGGVAMTDDPEKIKYARSQGWELQRKGGKVGQDSIDDAKAKAERGNKSPTNPGDDEVVVQKGNRVEYKFKGEDCEGEVIDFTEDGIRVKDDETGRTRKVKDGKYTVLSE